MLRPCLVAIGPILAVSRLHRSSRRQGHWDGKLQRSRIAQPDSGGRRECRKTGTSGRGYGHGQWLSREQRLRRFGRGRRWQRRPGGDGFHHCAPASALTTPDKCTSNAPGPRKLWRLSASELTASIRASSRIPRARRRSRRCSATRAGFLRRCQRAAGAGAQRLAARGQRRGGRRLGGVGGQLTAFANCATTPTLAASCATKFVQAFGQRAFRTNAGRLRCARRHLQQAVHGGDARHGRRADGHLGDAAVAVLPVPQRAGNAAETPTR